MRRRLSASRGSARLLSLQANMQQAKSSLGRNLQFAELLDSLTQSRDLGEEPKALRWTAESRSWRRRAPVSYLVLLQLQFLHVVELFRLQLAHPLVQLVDLVPTGSRSSRVIARPGSFPPLLKRRPTSACLRSGGRCSGLCVWRPGSSSSSPSRSLSYLPSSGRPDLANTRFGS